MSCLESAQREDFYERQAGRLALDPVSWFSVFQDSLPKMQNARWKPGLFICRLCVREFMQGREKLGAVVSLPSQDLAQFPVNVRSILRGLIDQLDPLLPRRLQLHLTQ
jgi:hypothetical protein